jgi:hypothetical protein
MARVLVRELVAWDLDVDANRPMIDKIDARAWQAQREIWKRPPHIPVSPILVEETIFLAPQFETRMSSIRASGEFEGLEWNLAIVDLRKLLAFQRRLCFDLPLKEESLRISPVMEDLLDLALPGKGANEAPDVVKFSETEVEIRSGNPNLKIVFAPSFKQDHDGLPLQVSYGSPYMEVAQYQDRWFLRDGYHRAYSLLRAGIFAVPAVVVEARTLEELGAVQPWFFPEEILFCDYPPQLLDYHCKKLVVEYERPAREKVIRVSLRESFETRQEDLLQSR